MGPLLCYRCGSHVPESSESCGTCGQKLSTGGVRQATATFSRRRLGQHTIEGAPYKPGDLIASRYEIKDTCAVGPVGHVFRARDTQMDVEVALKAINPRLLQTDEERFEFTKTLRLARKLTHPNAVRVYEEDRDGDRFFYTMQFLEGLSLRKIIDIRLTKGQFFTLREIEPILSQLANALEGAHTLGPHSDVKPENVVILPDLLKLTDFGLALAIPRVPFVQAVKQRKADRYLAPELVQGEPVDPRADIYSLGVIMGEMLSGLTPDDGTPPQLGERNPAVPSAIEGIYRKAVNRNSAARYSTPLQLLEDFSEALAKVEPPPLKPRSEPSSQTDTPVIVDEEPSESSRGAERSMNEDTVRFESAQVMAIPPGQPSPAQTVRVPSYRAAPRAKTLKLRKPSKNASQRRRSLIQLSVITFIMFVVGALMGVKLKDVMAKRQQAAMLGAPESQLPLPPPLIAEAPVGVTQPASPLPLADLPPPSLVAPPASAIEPPAVPLPSVSKALARIHVDSASHASDKRIRVLPVGTKKAEEKPAAAVIPVEPGGCPEGMVLIPNGSFRMGTAKDDPMMGFDEKVLSSAMVESFCMDIYEFPNKRNTAPTVNVSWADAARLCDAKGKRLCSETEWEKACKGPANTRYPYGNEFDPEACNTEDESGSDRSLSWAGKFSRCRSGYGIADLSGNVSEWTSSAYASSTDRVQKGGSFERPDYAARCSSRRNGTPVARSAAVGLRCCSDVAP